MPDLSFTANRIWRYMTATQKLEAAKSYWTGRKRDADDSLFAMAALARHYHLREKTVKKREYRPIGEVDCVATRLSRKRSTTSRDELPGRSRKQHDR